MSACPATEIIFECARLVDQGKASQVMRYFADNATLTFCEYAPNKGVLKGSAAISGFFSAREQNTGLITRHVVGNVVVASSSENRCDAEYLLTVYRGSTAGGAPDVTFVADVSESYEFDTHRGWLIVSRTVAPVFVFSKPV